MNEFEIRAPFTHRLLVFGLSGGLALFVLAGVRSWFNPGTQVFDWVRVYLPYIAIMLVLLLPVTHLAGRQPRVWIHGGNLFTRAAPLRQIQSLPISPAFSKRLLTPTLTGYFFTGTVLRGEDGARVTIPIGMFTRSQIRSLSEALSVASQSSPSDETVPDQHS